MNDDEDILVPKKNLLLSFGVGLGSKKMTLNRKISCANCAILKARRADTKVYFNSGQVVTV